MNTKLRSMVLISLLIIPQGLFSQELSASVTAGGRSARYSRSATSKIFISPMEGQLDGFVASELIKQKLPIIIVTQEHDADLVLAGVSLKADDHWYNVVFRGKDKNEGNVRLLDVHTKTMMWAGEAGDRSLWMAGWRRGGQRKVAERIVHQLKKDMFR